MCGPFFGFEAWVSSKTQHGSNMLAQTPLPSPHSSPTFHGATGPRASGRGTELTVGVASSNYQASDSRLSSRLRVQ